jgi:hypothetical protein
MLPPGCIDSRTRPKDAQNPNDAEICNSRIVISASSRIANQNSRTNIIPFLIRYRGDHRSRRHRFDLIDVFTESTQDLSHAPGLSEAPTGTVRDITIEDF